MQATSQPKPVSSKGHTVRIYNCSKQIVSIQASPPGGDFYIHEQQVHLTPGKSAELPKDHLRIEQINNLTARGILRVTYDSETAVGG